MTAEAGTSFRSRGDAQLSGGGRAAGAGRLRRRLTAGATALVVPLAASVVWATPASAATSYVVTGTTQVGSKPLAVAVDRSTSRVYVADQGSNSVSVIDGSTGAVVGTVAVGITPCGVAVDTSTSPSRVYVTNLYSNSMSVIDGSTRAVIDTVPVGSRPYGVAVDTSTSPSRVYVANVTSDIVSVIDGSTRAVIDTVPVGRTPNGVAVDTSTSPSRVYVTNLDSHSVSVIDGSTGAVVGTVPVGSAPRGVAVDTSTSPSRVYVANRDSASVSVIDGSTGALIDTVAVGASPFGVAVDTSTSPSRVYVANVDSDSVSVIDGSTRAVVDTVAVGDEPYGVGLVPGTSRAYVTNYFSSTVAVIEPAAPPSVTGTPPSPAVRGQAYDFSYTLTGTLAPTTSVTSGTLPPGLALSQGGRLSGTPTTGGSYTFTVTATNSVGDDSTVSTIVVGVGPGISGDPPSPATLGQAYDFTYTRTGTPGPTTTVTDGTLPPGLTLSEDGRLSGTPTEPGSYTFTVTASNALGSADTVSTLEVVPVLSVAIGDVRQDEGNSGTTTPFTFTATLNRASEQDVTVDYATADGTAVRATDSRREDYQARTGTLTFPAGVTSLPVTVPVTGGYMTEPDETFTVQLTTPSDGLSIVDGTGEGTIVNDDAQPKIRVLDAAVTEADTGTRTLRFPVRLDRPSSTTVTADFRTAPGTAGSPADFTAKTGTVSFAPNSTMAYITVQTRGDRLRERAETFTVTLSNPTASTLGDPTGTGTIRNND